MNPGRRRDRAEASRKHPDATRQTGAVAVRLRADEVEAHLTRRGLAALYFVSGDEPLRRTEIVAAFTTPSEIFSGWESVLPVGVAPNATQVSETNNLLFKYAAPVRKREGGRPRWLAVGSRVSLGSRVRCLRHEQTCAGRGAATAEPAK